MNRLRIAAVAVLVAVAVVLFLRFKPAPGPAAAPRPEEPAAEAATPERIWFALPGCVDDRFVVEPCSRVPGGGLYSLPALYDGLARTVDRIVPVFLGDMTRVRGEFGRGIAAYQYTEVLGIAGPAAAAAGPADLSHGTAFVRDVLSMVPTPVLCANATDASGTSILKGWALFEARSAEPGGRTQPTVLVVSTVSDALQGEVGIDADSVRLAPPAVAARTALAQGLEQARTLERKVSAVALIHHGSVEETAEIVRSVPGFTLAAATRGADLPDQAPYDAGGTPVFYTGRGMRFAWVVTVEKQKVVHRNLVRLGLAMLAKGSPIEEDLGAQAMMIRDAVFPDLVVREDKRPEDPRGLYVGAAACSPCHAEQVGAHSESAHRKLPDGFPEDALGRFQCLACHVTGASHRGGWAGRTDASDLAGVSCEACHGPGAAHVADPGQPYGAFPLTGCRTCHTPDRTPLLDAEALWKRWGHGLR